MKFILTYFFYLVFFFSAFAQEDSLYQVPVGPEEAVFCNPQLEGQGPSKGVVLSYQRIWDVPVTSTSSSPDISNASNVIQRNNELNFKAKLPVWNKPSFKILLGFEYEHQEFVFETDDLEYDLYQNLQQKHLKSIGGNITALKSLSEKKYVVVNVDANLNGDYSVDNLPTTDFLRVSFAGLYGIKPCPTKTYGFGIYYNYTFGRQRLLPAFLYNNTFSKKWGVEMLLPSEAKLRYNFDRNTLLYFGAEVGGANYNLVFDNPPLGDINNLQLRKSAIKGVFEFNQEIYDFIWFGISAGIIQPINFNLTEKDDRGLQVKFQNGIQFVRGDPLIRNELNAAPFAEVSLFLVPPRKIANKILNADQ